MTAVQDFERAGGSDIPSDFDGQPTGNNPPEGHYRVIQVANETSRWGDGDKMVKYTVALRNSRGMEKAGVEISRFHQKPAPKVGDLVQGDLKDEGKFGWKLKEAKQQGGGGGGGWKGKSSPEDRASIEAQVCVKSAAEITSALIAAGAFKGSPVDAAQATALADEALHRQLKELTK